MIKSNHISNIIKEFLSRVLTHAYLGTINDISNLLIQGPPGRKKPPSDISMHNWFSELDENNRAVVLSIIRKTAYSSIFNLLVILDNKTGGYPLEQNISDYCLSVNTYENIHEMNKYIPQEQIRFNLSRGNFNSQEYIEDLHDYFIYMLQELGEIEKR